ncbi:MAG TPA: hypothetical protein VHG32_22870 [Thermoanaerobaculia bacterium]|jgi:hypothetical protein|nr:hypothetical protein [Thermoanaerobaculia bacterium]
MFASQRLGVRQFLLYDLTVAEQSLDCDFGAPVVVTLKHLADATFA